MNYLCAQRLAPHRRPMHTDSAVGVAWWGARLFCSSRSVRHGVVADGGAHDAVSSLAEPAAVVCAGSSLAGEHLCRGQGGAIGDAERGGTDMDW